MRWGLHIYVLNIAVANLLMGFAVAVLLGHGPRRRPHLGVRQRLRRFWRRRAPAVVVSPPGEASAPSPSIFPPNESQALSTPAAAIGAPQPISAARAERNQPDQNWALPLDAVLAQLQSEVHGAGGQLAALDERVRRCAMASSPEEIAACTVQLRQVSQHILTQHKGALTMLDDTLAGNAETHADVWQIVRDQASEQCGLLCRCLEQLDGRPGGQPLEEQLQQLLSQTREVLAGCGRMGDCVSAAAQQLHQRQAGAPPADASASIAAPAPQAKSNFDHARTLRDESSAAPADALDEDALAAAVARTLAEVGGLREGIPANFPAEAVIAN